MGIEGRTQIRLLGRLVVVLAVVLLELCLTLVRILEVLIYLPSLCLRLHLSLSSKIIDLFELGLCLRLVPLVVGLLQHLR